jgi:prepilin-type N-terminal cleavage/methylation domain-containing protein
MKLTHKYPIKRKSGMTLIELTVVILVLLSLISILFIGARAWKKGSDRAGCILNLRNIQQAVRGDQNMKNKTTADSPVADDIMGTANAYLPKLPTCPATGTAYTAGTNYPDVGVLWTTCPNIATLTDHVPADVTGW